MHAYPTPSPCPWVYDMYVCMRIPYYYHYLYHDLGHAPITLH